MDSNMIIGYVFIRHLIESTRIIKNFTAHEKEFTRCIAEKIVFVWFYVIVWVDEV